MKKLLILLLMLLVLTYSCEAMTWTKDWSSQDDLTNNFGGDDLEDIQDDIDSQLVISSSNLTLSGDNTFSGTSTFSGSVAISAAQTFSGTVNFNGGLGIEPTTCYVGTFVINTATVSGTQAVIGVGFKPQAVIFFSTENSTSEASWGFDDGTYHGCLYDNDAASDGIYASPVTQSIVGIQALNDYYQGYVSSFDTDGFTITWDRQGNPTGTLTVVYLAFLI